MKKIGIVTKIDNNNYGNRLQNYALSTFISNNYDFVEVITLNNIPQLNNCNSFIKCFLKRIKYARIFIKFRKTNARLDNFNSFNKYINFSEKKYDNFNRVKSGEYDAIIVGSDQVWNYNFDMPDLFLGINVDVDKIYSYSASFGVSYIPKYLKKRYYDGLNKFKEISVREEVGSKIVKDLLNKDTYVHIDPTMLLSVDDWSLIAKKPENLISKKYILNYFLGDIPEDRKKEIERIAQENNCEIINILDKNDPFYISGPSEFLYLEKNAFLICTDSFHSSVFAILYNRPFVVFDREQKGVESMNSRIDTLINKFKLKNRRYNGKCITKENLNHDYTEAYKILEKERKKAKEFLEKALDIK